MKANDRSRRATLISLCCVVAVLWPGLGATYEVSFANLSRDRLPYGEPILITGTLSEVNVAGNKPVTEMLDVGSGFEATYSATIIMQEGDGKERWKKESALTWDERTRWLIPMPSLAENDLLVVRLGFKGKPSRGVIERVTKNVLDGKEYAVLVEKLFGDLVLSQEEEAPATLLQQFQKDFVALVRKETARELGGEKAVVITEPSATVMPGRVIYNMPAFVKRFKSYAKEYPLAFDTAALEAESLASMCSKQSMNYYEQGVNNKYPQNIQAFRDRQTYKDFASACRAFTVETTRLVGDVAASYTVGMDASATSYAREFSKYAGIDVGAIYTPVVGEFRSYFLVSAYLFGPVASSLKKMTDYKDALSVTFGVSLGELSQNGDSKIKASGTSYFLGLGYRLSQYFRLAGGSVLFRDKHENMRAEASAGLSVDLSALEFLTNAFGKFGKK